MRKRISNLVLSVLLLLTVAYPAYADVTTFGFDNKRQRITEGDSPVLWPAWEDKSGLSYSQPLILQGWGEFTGKTLVVAVTDNHLRGYVCKEPDNSGKYQHNQELWGIQLKGSKATKSHPTLVPKSNGEKYIYIGTDNGYLEVFNITTFRSPVKLPDIQDQWSSDIVSAPLVTEWKNHEIVIYTAGNTAEVHIAADPTDQSRAKNLRISLGNGRTSSSPAPIYDPIIKDKIIGFAMGLDQGPNAGQFRVYKLDEILSEENEKIVLKNSNASVAQSLPSGLVASFAVDPDKNEIFFGDCNSRVYGYNYETGIGWVSGQYAGTFSNRSPALTKDTIYFPATGQVGGKGRILSINRITHQGNWASEYFSDRAQTAPVIWSVPYETPVVLEGIGNGWLTMLYATDGTKFATMPISPKNNKEAYATGVSGEISASDNWVVVTTEEGVKAWRAIPNDFEVVSLDPGCPSDGTGYIPTPGTKYTTTAEIRINKAAFQEVVPPLAAFHELNGAVYPTKLRYADTGIELEADPSLENCQIHYFKPNDTIKVQFDWTAGEGEEYLTVGVNKQYPENNPILWAPYPEATPENNIKKVKVGNPDNLWVEILDYPKEAQETGTVTVKARIHNDKGKLLVTRLVWKVNGVVLKDINNYDLIGSLDDGLTFTMPKNDTATVTVEVNPDRDRPANELNYNDNKASCMISPIAVVIPPDKESSKLEIKISAPSKVDAFKKWSYTVTVKTNYPEPPPPPPGSNRPTPKPPKITMNMSATGQTADINVGYNIDTGYQKITQVNKSDQKVFSAGWGKRTHTFNYEYPATGLWGKAVTVTIKANATSSKGQSASDTAIVTINPWPIPKRELQLTY